jgi:Domain of unknown function (DUF4926)
MITTRDIVVLKENLPTEGLQAGDVGCVLTVYEDGESYEVEFATLTGRTISVVTVPPSAIRTIEPTDILHARAGEA